MDHDQEEAEIRGIDKDVLEAEMEVKDIIHKAEVEEKEAENDAIYATMVQWYFLEVGARGNFWLRVAL